MAKTYSARLDKEFYQLVKEDKMFSVILPQPEDDDYKQGFCIKFCETENDELTGRCLWRKISSVRTHVKGLNPDYRLLDIEHTVNTIKGLKATVESQTKDKMVIAWSVEEECGELIVWNPFDSQKTAAFSRPLPCVGATEKTWLVEILLAAIDAPISLEAMEHMRTWANNFADRTTFCKYERGKK